MVVVVVMVKVPRVMGSAWDEWLDEVDPKETEEVNEGSDERHNGGDLGERDHVEGRGVSDLVAPPVKEVVGHREEEREEHGVR